MRYLSKDIEALAKRRGKQGSSLIKKEHSCGIFQDYGPDTSKEAGENDQAKG